MAVEGTDRTDRADKLTKAEIIESIDAELLNCERCSTALKYRSFKDRPPKLVCPRCGYQTASVSKKNIHRILDLFFDQVKGGIIGQRAVELRGFGTFELKPRKGRVARNPRTGERVEVENHGVASFRPGRELKERAWSSQV